MSDYEDIKNCANDVIDIMNHYDKYFDSFRDICLRLSDFKYLILEKYR